MLKFLITYCNYRAVILEASFGSTLHLDDYVGGASGDTDSLLRQMGYWMFYSSEFRDFVNWVRDYNKVKPAEDRVHIVGMDMQTLLDPLRYIDKKSGSLPDEVRVSFEEIVQPFLKAYCRSSPVVVFQATDNMRTAAAVIVRELRKWVEDHQPALTLCPQVAGESFLLSR